MSMVHPGMLTARSGANDGPRADDDLRQYVHSEYREKETHWLASSGIRGNDLKVPRARDTSTMPDIVDLDNTAPVRVRGIRLIMSAFSENRLIKWLVPRGETAGER